MCHILAPLGVTITHVETRTQRVIQRLEREGWHLQRHGASHDIYRHPEIEGIITVPRHRSLSPGMARTIYRKAGWEEH